MSKSIGIFEAKSQFSRIVQDAEGGQDTIITRHGRPVARVTPAEPVFDWDKVRHAGAALEALRADLKARGVKVTHQEIRSWINEGRP
jgi:prevent-host-death family protein